MCIRPVEAGLVLLEYVPDWFVTQEKIDLWHDDDCWYNDDKLVKWYEGYKKRRVQKA